MTEEMLVERLRMKDPEAVREFYEVYGARVRRVARQFVTSEQDAEEIVQDVVWTVYRKVDAYKGTTQLWGWVYRITQNAARMHLRSARRQPIPMEDSVVEAMMNEVELDATPVNPRPDHVVEHTMAVERLNRRLAHLHPINRALFREVDLHGSSIQDTAASTGMTVSAVKARLHRVRSALREAVIAG